MCYRDNSGLEHESYDAACHYYGVDTPAQAEAEAEFWAKLEEEEELVARQDMMEAIGGPLPAAYFAPAFVTVFESRYDENDEPKKSWEDEEIPF